ncbi:GNAT family N-acetyltransferase [Planotetraspora sp. GP83]|uniref:GNAT family N-acetyltransferase n=1 Tax=Planotetraspora sp. GP83 TaxID=3156264 RepID=UPI0035124ADA
MKIEVVRPGELGPAELERWRALQRAHDTRPNPFLSPEYSVAVGEVRANARVAVIDGGEAFFPFERHAAGVGKPIGAGLSDLQGMVHAPGLEVPPRELLKACDLAVWEFDHLDPAQFPRHHKALHPSPIIDMSDGYESYAKELAERSNKIYKSTLKKERRLGREVGEVRFLFDSPDSDALRTLLRWKSAQYQRTGRSDRFAQPWIVRLVERLHQINTDVFVGTLGLLYAGDRLVAGNFGVRTEDVLVGWFPTYDPEYARYSPGLIHRLRLCRASSEAGVTLMDLGRGEKGYKDSLKNGELMVAEGRIARPSLSAAAHWLTYEPRRRIGNLVLGTPVLYKTADRAAKWLGARRTDTRP